MSDKLIGVNYNNAKIKLPKLKIPGSSGIPVDLIPTIQAIPMRVQNENGTYSNYMQITVSTGISNQNIKGLGCECFVYIINNINNQEDKTLFGVYKDQDDITFNVDSSYYGAILNLQVIGTYNISEYKKPFESAIMSIRTNAAICSNQLVCSNSTYIMNEN